MKKLSALVAAAVLVLAGCGKAPPPTGTGAFKVRDNVWATYGWSKGRMAYILYFIPPSGFDPEGLAAKVKPVNESDMFEGSLDGAKDKGKSPFRADPKKGEVQIEGKTYRGSAIFLVNPAGKEKVQLIQGITFGPAPKDPEEWPVHAENEARRISKDPKIADFPNEPAPTKPDPKKKK
jgi:hypothetical protein